MAKNVAVGLLRPPHVFFYEIDVKANFRIWRKKLIESCKRKLDYFSIYRSKHGYHVIGSPYRQIIWLYFKRRFRSDFTRKLRFRFGRKSPQILRISEKWDLKTGKVVSPKPKFICGNFFLHGIMNYKVLYYAK